MALRQVPSGRPPKAVYHPWNFRGWWAFGTGALGDMGCHHFNTTFRALKLTYPTRISASATRVFDETAPLGSIVTFDYPARKGMPPVRVVWYDGGLKPLRPNRRSGTWGEWVEAIRGGQPAGCDFDWADYLTAAVLLGNIAIRTGKTLDWDAQQRRFTNYEPANKYLSDPYRSGWTLA